MDRNRSCSVYGIAKSEFKTIMKNTYDMNGDSCDNIKTFSCLDSYCNENEASELQKRDPFNESGAIATMDRISSVKDRNEMREKKAFKTKQLLINSTTTRIHRSRNS